VIGVSLFIVFEGLDGAGNTTQSKLLAAFLKKRGHNLLLTKEPTQNPIGKIIRSVLQKRMETSPVALQVLFTADRGHHLHDVIEPALERGKTVISDRYMFSTMAFGGIDVDIDFLKRINSQYRVPDITFIMDVPVEVAMERINSRSSESEFFEETSKLEKVRENYLSLKDDFPNIHVIDGTRTINQVAADVQRIVLSKLG
jgi:dTMP kinase